MHSRRHQNYLVYVGVRLLDLHRILDFRGSFYLYCDAAAAHYLKCVLDCIFFGGQLPGGARLVSGGGRAGGWQNILFFMF